VRAASPAVPALIGVGPQGRAGGVSLDKGSSAVHRTGEAWPQIRSVRPFWNGIGWAALAFALVLAKTDVHYRGLIYHPNTNIRPSIPHTPRAAKPAHGITRSHRVSVNLQRTAGHVVAGAAFLLQIRALSGRDTEKHQEAHMAPTHKRSRTPSKSSRTLVGIICRRRTRCHRKRRTNSPLSPIPSSGPYIPRPLLHPVPSRPVSPSSCCLCGPWPQSPTEKNGAVKRARSRPGPSRTTS